MNTKKSPDVSVIVPAWCAQDMLEACAATALAQRDVSVEVVIVDDASPDATFAKAQALAAADERIKALQLPRNSGPAGARNLALQAAAGEWVAVLDVDDLMVSTRLKAMIDLANAQAADVVLGNLMEVDASGVPLDGTAFISTPGQPTQWDVEAFVAGNMIASGGKSYGYLKPLIRRRFLAEKGVRYDPSLRNGEDFHLILSCYEAGAAVWFAPAPDYLYTRRAGSLSHRSDPSHILALIAADAAFAARNADQPGLCRLMQARQRGLSDIHTTELVLRALKKAQVRAAAAAFARRPQSTGRILRQLAEAVGKRL